MIVFGAGDCVDFGSRLKVLRLYKNMKQEDLAHVLSISKSAVGMYERNERQPSFEIIEKISQFFNVSIDYLITGKEHEVECKSSIDLSSLSDEDIKEVKKYISYIKWKSHIGELE